MLPAEGAFCAPPCFASYLLLSMSVVCYPYLVHTGIIKSKQVLFLMQATRAKNMDAKKVAMLLLALVMASVCVGTAQAYSYNVKGCCCTEFGEHECAAGLGCYSYEGADPQCQDNTGVGLSTRCNPDCDTARE